MENLSEVLLMWVLIYGFIAGTLFVTVASWVLYVKADQPGWAMIIPFYNLYVMLEIAGRPGWWVILWFIPIPIIQIILMVIMYWGVAQNFGKGVGYTIGLFFLSPIFIPLLAFGDAEYEG